MMFLSCEVTCPRCGHTWIYWGKRLRELERGRQVKVPCPRCHGKVPLNTGKGIWV